MIQSQNWHIQNSHTSSIHLGKHIYTDQKVHVYIYNMK